MSKIPFGLGRGLDALIPAAAKKNVATTSTGTSISVDDSLPSASDCASPFKFVAIDEIVPNPRQPRVHFDPEELEALADSLRRYGLLP